MNIINIPDPIPCLNGEIRVLGVSDHEVTFLASGFCLTQTPNFNSTRVIRTKLLGYRGECLIFQIHPGREMIEKLPQLQEDICRSLAIKLQAECLLSQDRR